MKPSETFQFGAVYFRKSNPPAEDWERDYRVAAEDGQTLFRHWVIRSQIELAPGVYDWADYDRQLELAHQNGIQVVLAEMVNDVPDWYFRRMEHARAENRRGEKRWNEMNGSSVSPVGGLCLDHPEVLDAGERFLAEMARHFRGHPALFAYDIWNECTFYHAENACCCPATEERFREWLKERYQCDLRALAKIWKRGTLLDWEDVRLPRQIGPYPEVMDAQRFYNDNAQRLMQWRRDVLLAHDPNALVISHGNARSFADIASCCGDDFRAAEKADIFGYTYYHGTQCQPFLAGDLIRCASRGKPFWRAEAVGNADWAYRQLGRPSPAHDRMADPENIRLDCLVSMACGASAYMNPRWRPLLDGPLFGAFGWYGMDGSRTPRSEMIRGLAEWAHRPEVQPLWQARPLDGEAAILILDEAQAQCFGLYANTDAYSRALQGAYAAFSDAGIQCDLAKLANIGRYPLLYLPYPLAMSEETITALNAWVRQGGCLVSEACPGYFDEYAHAFPVQPARGLAKLFGCREEAVSFGLDVHDGLKIRTAEGSWEAGVYRQSYQMEGGQAAGWFEDGNIAVVDHSYGKGRTRLVGSMPGYGYFRAPGAQALDWFRGLLAYAGRAPRIQGNHPSLVVRLWENMGYHYLWAVNQSSQFVACELSLEPTISCREAQILRGGPDALQVEDGKLCIRVPGREAIICQLSETRSLS